MADLSRQQLERLARRGARALLEELESEAAAIRRAFPDLFGGRRGRKASGGATGRRRRRGMSASARKAVSERMKKYWADRRKAKNNHGWLSSGRRLVRNASPPANSHNDPRRTRAGSR